MAHIGLGLVAAFVSNVLPPELVTIALGIAATGVIVEHRGRAKRRKADRNRHDTRDIEVTSQRSWRYSSASNQHPLQNTSSTGKILSLRYMYHRLDPKQKQMRILQLLPGESEMLIRCRLITVNISTNGKCYTIEERPQRVHWTALSYHWGEPSFEREIELEGKPIWVTKTLELALWHMRSRTEEHLLWVDALCINQEDDRERSHQVTFMKDIYQKAAQVKIWLGDEDKHTKKAFNVLERAKANFTGDLTYSFEECVINKAVIPTESEWDAVKKLLIREYWNRIWVVQECTVARKLVLVCGKYSIEAKILHFVLEHYHNLPGFKLVRPSRAYLLLDENRKYILSNGEHMGNTLESLLQRHRCCEAKDPRDKIYALLGIANDLTPYDIPIDYSKTLKEVQDDVDFYYLSLDRDAGVSRITTKYIRAASSPDGRRAKARSRMMRRSISRSRSRSRSISNSRQSRWEF